MAVTEDAWLDLGPLNDLPEGQPSLRKSGDQRFVCVRRGDRVDALDDRCPHQGYPLSQGRVVGGVLTCEWHNWKFELGSGACLFGGEPVRRYPTRVEGGRIHLDVSIDHEAEAERFDQGLRAALRDDDASRALREGLRLGVHRPQSGALGSLASAFEVLAEDGAARAEYGFDHGLAMLADVLAWVERGVLPAAEAFALAATCVAEPSRGRDPRPRPRMALDRADDASLVRADLAHERREMAELRARHLCRRVGAERALLEGLAPFATSGIYDYGHGSIFVTKALELCQKLPHAAEEIVAAVAVNLGWATNETALPPFTTTRTALAVLDENTPDSTAKSFDRGLYEGHVLESEKEAVASTTRLLAEGCSPQALLLATAHAAAERVRRFDDAWEGRADAEVSILDVTHAVTFAEACWTLAQRSEPRVSAQMAVAAAGFVGKLKRADRREPRALAPRSTYPTLSEAATARDADAARTIAFEMRPEDRQKAYADLGPFLAFEMAVRPIFAAHGVKMGEALRRLDALDPEGGSVYLDALLAYAVPRRKERRYARVAHVATKFLADGRPPEGLY